MQHNNKFSMLSFITTAISFLIYWAQHYNHVSISLFSYILQSAVDIVAAWLKYEPNNIGRYIPLKDYLSLWIKKAVLCLSELQNISWIEQFQLSSF